MHIDEMGVYRCQCGKPIFPYSRVKDGYENCIECSKKTTSHRVGFMVFSHKTAPELITIDSNNKEGLRLAKRAHRRAR